VRAPRNVTEALAAVRADGQASAWLVNRVLVLRVHDQIGEVKGAPDHVLAAVERGPGSSAVFRAVQAIPGRLGFDEDINDVGLRWSDREGQAAPRFGRKSPGGFL